MYYLICPFQLVSEEIWYANPDGLQPQEVLSKVTREDFQRQNQKLLFTDESREHVFSHVCLFEPVDGIAVMKIANKYVELEKELEELKAKQQGSSDGDEISKLQQENLDLKEQVKAYEEQQQEETNLAQIDFQNKVRLDLLLRLMKKDGADLEKHGNKRRAAIIMNIVTGIPIPTCKNYCSEPILSENSHKREIADINPVLQKLGMQTTL